MNQKTVGNLLTILGFCGATLISVRLIYFMSSDEYGLDSGMYALFAWAFLWDVPLFYFVTGISGILITKNKINRIYFIITSILGVLSLPMFYYFYPFGLLIYSIEVYTYVAVGILIFFILPLLLNTNPQSKTN